jgi:hypothetical protein
MARALVVRECEVVGHLSPHMLTGVTPGKFCDGQTQKL